MEQVVFLGCHEPREGPIRGLINLQGKFSIRWLLRYKKLTYLIWVEFFFLGSHEQREGPGWALIKLQPEGKFSSRAWGTYHEKSLSHQPRSPFEWWCSLLRVSKFSKLLRWSSEWSSQDVPERELCLWMREMSTVNDQFKELAYLLWVWATPHCLRSISGVTGLKPESAQVVVAQSENKNCHGDCCMMTGRWWLENAHELYYVLL